MASLTDVPGVLVGHAQNMEALTGVTVILTPEGASAGVDIRGGGPASRETDVLNPTATVDKIHAVCLTGGSAFGLQAAGGVMNYLSERQIGFDTGFVRVPIVPAAAIFDLVLGRADVYPDAQMGYVACQAASDHNSAEGCVGAGTGASIGKLFSVSHATKGGVGMASERLPGDVVVAALVVCNAAGDVYEDGSQRIIAGARSPDGGGFANTSRCLRSVQAMMHFAGTSPPGPVQVTHTTLVVTATNAVLSKAECTKMAQMAQDGLARTIRPVHTPFDGDAVFALATGRGPRLSVYILGSIAADVVAQAVMRSAWAATPLGGLPSASQLATKSRSGG